MSGPFRFAAGLVTTPGAAFPKVTLSALVRGGGVGARDSMRAYLVFP